MIENVNVYTDFLVKNKLSTNQFYLLLLLYQEGMYQSDDGLKYKTVGNIYKWTKEGKGWSIKEIEELIEKDFIFGIKRLSGGVYTYPIDQLILTQKFSDIMFINGNFAFDEILELYPDTFIVNTTTVFSKSGDLNKVQDNYSRLIKGSISKHEEIKKVVLYAKERGLCNYKLENFLSKGVIDSIKKMMGESHGTGTDI